MQEREQDQTELEQIEAEKVEPIAIYKNNIYALVDDVKDLSQFQGLTDQELKENKAFFPVLIDYIYNTYIGELLDNKRGKQNTYTNIDIIDDLFNIYINLVYKYKWNNKPFIVEFATFIGVSNDTIYRWLKGEYKGSISDPDATMEEVTRYASEIVQKWQGICERALLNGTDTIRDIFILKAKHGYRDNNNDVTITVNHKTIVSADDLPALIEDKAQ